MKILLYIIIVFLNISCADNVISPVTKEDIEHDAAVLLMREAILNSRIHIDAYNTVLWHINNNPDFIKEFNIILNEDPYLRLLVDKSHLISSEYEPDDLVLLDGPYYTTARSTLMLRKKAAYSLEEMAASAREEGLTLQASSAYRAFIYQAFVYKDNVINLGQEAADKLSARPGTSQHQLGLALDFGSIDDSFAQTDEGLWLAKNAWRYGWSLSYPEGYEKFTGYQYESWHYRYVGKNLAAFIKNYFCGIQQFALRFFHEYEQQKF